MATEPRWTNKATRTVINKYLGTIKCLSLTLKKLNLLSLLLRAAIRFTALLRYVPDEEDGFAQVQISCQLKKQRRGVDSFFSESGLFFLHLDLSMCIQSGLRQSGFSAH